MNNNAVVNFIASSFNEIWIALDSSQSPDLYSENIMLEMNKKMLHYQNIVRLLAYVKQRYLTVYHQALNVFVGDNKIIVSLQQDYGIKKDEKSKFYVTIAVYQIQNNEVLNTWCCMDPSIDYFEH